MRYGTGIANYESIYHEIPEKAEAKRMKDKKKLTDTTELFHDIDYRKLVETIMDELEYATLIDDQCRVIYMSKKKSPW